MNLAILEKYIQDNNYEEAIKIVDEIGSSKSIEAVPLLIKHLEKTENHLLRNAIALALYDIGDPKAVEPMINLLKDPKTLGYRGTLLYALEPFDYSEHTDLLTSFLYQGNFEVSRNSFLLLENIKSDIPPIKRQLYIDIIKKEIDELEKKIDFLSEAIEMLA